MSIIFAPGGKPDSYGKRKFPQELPAYLDEFGLNGFEFECGRGVNIAEETYKFFSDRQTMPLRLSLHAPYYISLSSPDEETRLKSIRYILQSAKAAKRLGSERIVVHSGSCGKMKREEALELAKDTLVRVRSALAEAELSDIIICPETMGKINQLGTLEEVIELCKTDESFLPCVDFGHLNARTHGGIKTKADYGKIFDTLEDKLGCLRVKNFHLHFSKIQYTDGGEKTHLTFEDAEYGPDFEPLMEVIAERDYQPFIICESQGTQAEDARTMKKYYERFLKSLK
ncbi:MAG: TIM barrel protein [Oscillospiraceae bacterium]|jgi:deoxyribonuclease-4|nr:TIM barrel protein [Oscillospiraceae bacterium]